MIWLIIGFVVSCFIWGKIQDLYMSRSEYQARSKLNKEREAKRYFKWYMNNKMKG